MGSATPRVPLQLSPNAMTVLEKRYLVRDETGKPIERAEDLFERVAKTIANADRGYGASEGAVEALAEEGRGGNDETARRAELLIRRELAHVGEPEAREPVGEARAKRVAALLGHEYGNIVRQQEQGARVHVVEMVVREKNRLNRAELGGGERLLFEALAARE